MSVDMLRYIAGQEKRTIDLWALSIGVVDHGKGAFGFATVYLTFKWWLLPVVFFCYPLFLLISHPLRRHLRYKRRACLRCGYNLTGNESGRCPECGTETLSPPRSFRRWK